MSMCAGKTKCEIYRDKRYCRRAEERTGAGGVCDCRHAIRPCEVSICGRERACGRPATALERLERVLFPEKGDEK